MHRFTDERNAESVDEIWLVQHPQIFTLGQSGGAEHVLLPSTIPVFQSDRGGKVTFHGPGQQVMYILLDLHRCKIGVRSLVTLLEQTVIATLAHFSISAYARADAPGVYVGINKICSLGLRIQKGCTFHGLALNVKMDLLPFLHINPCGHVGLRMTQVSDLASCADIDDVAQILISECLKRLIPLRAKFMNGGGNPRQYNPILELESSFSAQTMRC
ncbi:MAG: lipoyl(octanoyl) transferase LipB [Sodalis sp. (in: enterobacteria)]